MTKEELVLIASFKDNMSAGLKSVNGLMGGLKKAIGALGIYEVGKAFISAAADIEQTKVAFTTMLDSAEGAEALLKELSAFAATTPFEIKGVEQSAKQLMAYGFEVQELIPTLRSLGDVSAGLSVPIEQIVYAYGQVRAAGQLYGTELRQFVNAGVPILKTLADQYGVTAAEAKKMVEEGKVGFKDVEKAFQSMSGEGGKFFNLMENQSKTLAGQWSNLKDVINIFMRENGKALAELAKSFIQTALAALKFYEQNKEIINIIVKVIAAFALFYVGGGKLIAMFIGLKSVILGAIQGMKLMLANPILLFFALAAGAVAYLADRFGGLKNAFIVIGSAFNILGQLVVIGLKQMSNTVIKFINAALKAGNKIYNFFSGLLKKVGVDIGEANMSIDFEFDTAKNQNNISQMLTMMDNMKMQAEAKRNEQNATFDELYGQDLVNYTESNLGKEESNKKLADSFEDLKEKIVSVAEDSSKALEEVGEKINEIQQKILDLKTKKAEDDLSMRQSYAQAYVDQEQKVQELSQQWANETDQAKKDSLYQEFLFNQNLLNQKKTIELAYQNEVNEARRRASLSDFERQLEDLDNKKTIANLEFEAEYNKLQMELKAEEEKQKALIQLNEWALKEADKILAQGEKQTVDSVNRQIAYYNQLAKAIKNAQEGRYTSYASLAKGTSARMTAENKMPSLNITVNGDVSGQELVEKVKQGIMGQLSNNTQLSY